MEKEYNLSKENVTIDLKSKSEAEDDKKLLNYDNSLSKAALISYLIS